MSLLKRNISRRRHVGRRVVGVAAGVALLVLGLEAPAFAVPTVASFTPTSGPEDCVVIVTGTGFTDFPIGDTDVQFVNTADATDTTQATDWARNGGTELWVVVPALDNGLTYNIRYDDPSTSGVTSTGSFLFTPGVGACAPTITSFTPTCGGAGTSVVITGTNLIGPDLFGGDVRFNPYTVDAVTVQPDPDIATSLSRIVPSGLGAAADGPIRVETFDTDGAAGVQGGVGFSTTAFQVPPPDCVPAGAEGHERAITLKLKKTGKASGVVSSTEDPAFTDCVAAVPVKIQRKTSGGWKNVGSTTTTDTGSYTKKTKGKPGKYRALAPKVAGTTAADDCLKAKSATRTIKG